MKSSFNTKCGRWILLVLAACATEGQDQVPAEVRALPVWVGEDAAFLRRPPQYVFRDANGEIVVSYPNPSNPERMITFRFWLANRVDPHIGVSVTGGDVGFTYTYTLQNGSGAAVAIRQWSVVGPANQDLTVSHPIWRGLNARVPVATQALVPGVAAGAYLLWMGGDTPHIQPGGEARDFTIRSTFAPGLTTAYVGGEGAVITEPGPGELPEVVVAQIIPLQRAPVSQKPMITIGPRFSPGTPAQAITDAFRIDVADLIKEGLLSAESPYVQELQRVLMSGRGDSSAQLLLRKETPLTAMEKDLDAALRISTAAPR
jgi:hypothetical protein